MKTLNPHFVCNILLTMVCAALLAGCASTVERLDQVGKPPALNKVENPVVKADYQPLTWPTPSQAIPDEQYSGSLWQPGARHFFRDQRAGRVGDIVRVMIKIADKAEIESVSSRERDSSQSLNASKLFGLEEGLYGLLPGSQDPSNLLSIGGSGSSEGTGTIEREEIIETQVAAIVTQILPNGNMVIQGSQEVRINFEIREVSVAGVIRPEDIKADNSIESNQIAQARISYGGRGQMTDVQQPRWGNQVIDILSPF